MKFKPKEIQVNLPTVLTFSSEDDIVEMASAFNTFVHGKVKMKYEVLGMLGGQCVGLFYIQRNNESQELRDEFTAAINQEEQTAYSKKNHVEEDPRVPGDDFDDEPQSNVDLDDSETWPWYFPGNTGG